MATNAHYAHIRYLGLADRVTGTNEAPLRVVGGKLGVKRKGVILPVHAIDAEGYALVRITDKAHALAQTPRNEEGRFDFDALSEIAPAITNPWDVPELAGLKTVGTKADAEKPKASKAEEPVVPAPAMQIAINVGAKKAAPAKAPAPAKAEPAPQAMDREAVIAYLASLTGEGMADMIASLQAAKAAPMNQNRKGKAKARSAR